MQSRPEEEIRARAYQIWEEEGRPEGHAQEHWYRASDELERAAENRFGGPDDLQRNPGIGTSAGTDIEDHDLLEGESTFEGDVLNDSTREGGVDPDQRGRTNV